jgi:four helix bundle protein
MGDFRKLVAWQEAMRLSLLSRRAIASLPRNERYALGEQWRRAAYSVVLNIAEGAGQPTAGQFRRYLRIAIGSLDELQAVFEVSEAMGYLSAGELEDLKLCRRHCARLVVALSRRTCPTP